MQGMVTLIGAGAGDGLLTIDGLKALKRAEVAVCDRLLGEDIYELIPNTAEIIYAGKAAANHTMPQGEINRLLIAKAKEGKNVIRLKGGDSYLFGRGGEEGEALYNEGIPFRVIPGVSSAIAAPAFGGIPVTHRDYASSVHIYTGHKKQGEALDINFKACVETGGTLVFLMAVKNAGYIVRGLIKAGMDKNMPCAFIERGCCPFQKTVVTALERAEKEAESISSPAVFAVGRVCALSDRLNWFDALPLKGKKIVIARPHDRAEGLKEGLRELGAYVRVIPSIKTEIIPCKIAELTEKSEAVAFTSPFGVKAAFELLNGEGKDARVFAGKAVAAVGDKTGAELAANGIRADIIPTEQTGAALGKALCERGLDNILILRAEKGAEGITAYLKEKGINYTDKAVYKTKICPVRLKDKADYVVFGSPSQLIGYSENKKDYIGVCIGKYTAAEAERQGISYITAEKPTDEGIIDIILRSVKTDEHN